MAPKFPNLKCKYSGAVMTLEHDDAMPNVGWYLKGGFDPKPGFLNRAEAETALKTRDGVRKVKTLRCPYTGSPIVIEEFKGMFFAAGDYFSPNTRWQTKERLLDEVSRYNGRWLRTPLHHLKPKITVKEPLEPRSEPTEDLPDAVDDAREFVDRQFNEMGIQ